MPASTPSPQPATRTREQILERKVQLGIGLIAALALVALGVVIVRRQPMPLQVIKTNQSIPSTGTIFSDLFQVAYRPDQGVGNVAVATVYYFPALQRALDQYTQKSEHQQEVAAALNQLGANDRTLVFYLLIDSVVPQNTLDLSTGVTLTDGQGEQYPLQSWQQLTTALPQEPNQVRTASLLVFDKTSASGKTFPGDTASLLKLSIKGLASVSERVFNWRLAMLPR